MMILTQQMYREKISQPRIAWNEAVCYNKKAI